MFDLMKTLCFLLLLISHDSRAQNNKVSSSLIEINVERNLKNVKTICISDLKGELKYITLKGNSIQLKTIALSDFSKNRMILSDRFNCVLSDLDGNILCKVSDRGQGPGEYVIVSSIRFGPNDNIFLQNGLFFLVYDLSGKFQRQFTLEVDHTESRFGGCVRSWAQFNDNLFIGQVSNDTGREKYKAIFFNERGETIISVPNHILLNSARYYMSGLNSTASIYYFEGRVLFKEMLNDTVFQISDQFLFKPVYNIILGKYKEPVAERENHFAKRNFENYIWLHPILETANYLFLTGSFGRQNIAKRSQPILIRDHGSDIISWYFPASMMGVYDKQLKELAFAEPLKSENRYINDGLRNDIDGGINFYPSNMVNDSTLAMWVDAFELKEHVSSEAFKNSTPKYPEKKKELERLANSLSDNDNPVLILCTFKK